MRALLVFFLLSGTAGGAEALPSSSDTAQILEFARSSDTALRRQAVVTLAREYKKRWLGAAALPVLRERISDKDPETRVHAAMCLAGIASFIHLSSRSAEGKAFGRRTDADFSADPHLLKALLTALGDRRSDAREYAAAALGFAYPPLPRIEAALLRRWPKEKSAPVRSAILNALANGGYRTAKVLALARSALKDRDPLVRKRAEELLREPR
ncbi:MAG: HEAT repeat domain-containing protein [Elusimicrobiota bacterium]